MTESNSTEAESKSFEPARSSYSPDLVTFEWRGLWDYREALATQESRAQLVADGRAPPIVWGLEHPLVLTLGRRSQQESAKGVAPIVWVERGGEATLHQPGQLVIYPILPITDFGGVRTWVEFLLKVTRQALESLGVRASCCNGGAGLWTDQGKICFVGLRIIRGISSHGLSLNVSNDLSDFRQITACGVKNPQIDRLCDHGVSLSPHEFFLIWQKCFQDLVVKY